VTHSRGVLGGISGMGESGAEERDGCRGRYFG